MKIYNYKTLSVGLFLTCLISSGIYWDKTLRVNVSDGIDTTKTPDKVSINSQTETLKPTKSQDGILLITESLKSLETKIAGMGRRIGQFQNELDLLNSNKQAVDESAESEQVMDEEEMGVYIENRRIQQELEYENQFLSELKDVEWSQSTETKVFETLAQVADRLSARNFQCKSSMCRLSLSRAKDETSNDSVFEAFESGVNWEGEMYINYDPDSGEGVAYLARPGHALPELDEG